MNIGWMNGNLIDLSKKGMNFSKAGFRYGINVFDALRVTTRIKNNRKIYIIFKPYRHLSRFVNGIKHIGMKLDYSEEEILEAIINVIKKNKVDGMFGVRLFCFSNNINLTNDIDDSNLLIYLIDLKKVSHCDNYSLKIMEHPRINDGILPATIKSTSHYAKSKVCLTRWGKGYDDLIYVNKEGDILETSRANIFIIKNNNVLTSKSFQEEILEGITRETIIDLIKNNSIFSQLRVLERRLSIEDLLSAEEVFISSTSIGIRRILKINKTLFTVDNYTSKIYQSLLAEYKNLDSPYNYSFCD